MWLARFFYYLLLPDAVGLKELRFWRGVREKFVWFGCESSSCVCVRFLFVFLDLSDEACCSDDELVSAVWVDLLRYREFAYQESIRRFWIFEWPIAGTALISSLVGARRKSTCRVLSSTAVSTAFHTIWVLFFSIWINDCSQVRLEFQLKTLKFAFRDQRGRGRDWDIICFMYVRPGWHLLCNL